MKLLDYESLMYWLEQEEKQQRSRFATTDEKIDLPFTRGILSAIDTTKQYIKAMPDSSELCDKKPGEHYHDYFLASISEASFHDKEHSTRSYRYGTLICRCCGETKSVKLEKCAL